MTERFCPRCDRTLSTEAFYRRKDGKLQSYCKACTIAYGKARYAAKTEHCKAMIRRWRGVNPMREQVYSRKAYLKVSDPEQRRRQRQAYYQRNKARINARNQRWRADNVEQVRERDRTRKREKYAQQKAHQPVD